jgi:hypothetical protein
MATQLITDYVRGVERIWFCHSIDITRHWQKVHPYHASTSCCAPPLPAKLVGHVPAF